MHKVSNRTFSIHDILDFGGFLNARWHLFQKAPRLWGGVRKRHNYSPRWTIAAAIHGSCDAVATQSRLGINRALCSLPKEFGKFVPGKMLHMAFGYFRQDKNDRTLIAHLCETLVRAISCRVIPNHLRSRIIDSFGIIEQAFNVMIDYQLINQ